MINGHLPYAEISIWHHELLAAAEQERLAAAYRRAHPELRLRSRLANRLRAIADRLAPEPPPAHRSPGRTPDPSTQVY